MPIEDGSLATDSNVYATRRVVIALARLEDVRKHGEQIGSGI